MKQNEADNLAKNLIDKFGIALKAEILHKAGEDTILLIPVDVHPNDGFQIRITIGWRSLYFDLILGKFAADLLHQFAASAYNNKKLFSTVAAHILAENGTLSFKINDLTADVLNPVSWPSEWYQLAFSLRKSPLEINTGDDSLTEKLLNSWTEKFLGCILALTPLEEIEINNEMQGAPEGALSKVMVNRYERSQYNRTICINFHGCTCKVCGFDFSKVYGEFGNGFIHVHHIVPVSKLGPEYIINPIEDLVPVCPNCHSMLHKTNPPLSIQDLNKIILVNSNVKTP